MSVVIQQNGSISLIERINALLTSMEIGKVYNCREMELIRRGFDMLKYANNSRYGGFGDITPSVEQYQETAQAYRNLCKRCDEVDASLKIDELNTAATTEMVFLWNRAHEYIYTAKVYENKDISGEFLNFLDLYRYKLLSLLADIWKDDIVDECQALNYLTLKCRYNELLSGTTMI